MSFVCVVTKLLLHINKLGIHAEHSPSGVFALLLSLDCRFVDNFKKNTEKVF